MKGKDAEKGSDDFNAMVKVWNAEAQETYGKGMLKFDLYQDVHGVVQRIRQSGHKIALFSSASVDGLKSAFKASTIHGFINRFFSSEDVGGKYEPGSYQKIAHDLGVSIGDMIYVSEDERESAQQLQVEE
jgi:methionine salvage enolase-phosphatase E1